MARQVAGTEHDGRGHDCPAAKISVKVPEAGSAFSGKWQRTLPEPTGVIAGAISGRALYDGAIDLTQALTALKA